MGKRPLKIKSSNGIKIDPELAHQIELAGKTGGSVTATFTLRSPAGGHRPSPDVVDAAVSRVLDRAAQAANSDPDEVNVYPFMNAFSIVASALFITVLLEQPEVGAALAEQPGGQPIELMRPVRKRSLRRGA
jgi:hypothetical protein